MMLGGGNSNMFIFLGKIPILTDISNISNIFQMG